MKKNHNNDNFDQLLDDFISQNSYNPFEEKFNDYCDDCCKNDDTENKEPIGVNRCKIYRYNDTPTSDMVTVSLYFTRQINENDNLLVKCHNSCYLPIGETEVKAIDSSDVRPYAKVHLQSDYAWLHDVYHFVVYNDNKPIDSFSFTYNGKKFIRNGYHTVTRQSTESIIVESDFQESSWNIIRKTPGAKSIIDAVIEFNKKNLLNSWRKKQSLTEIPLNKHFVVHSNVSLINSTLPYLLCPNFSTRTANCDELCEPRATADPYELANDIFDNAENKVIKLTNILSLIAPSGMPVANKIIHNLEKRCYQWSLLIVGSHKEVEALFAAYPAIKKFIPSNHYLSHHISGSNELVHYATSYFSRHQFKFTRDAQIKVKEIIERDFSSIMLSGNAVELVTKTLSEIISGNVGKRIFNSFSDNIGDKSAFMSTIEECDFDGVIFGKSESCNYADCMNELNSLVGLTELKQNIATAMNKMKLTQMRRQAGLKNANIMPNHFIFTGNPGTGKTTVAKMLGKVFHSIGILSRGDVVVTERSKLVGRYIGETERNVNEVLRRAQGNVLFIDEAYTLYDGANDRKDFGMRVIEALLTVLAQPDPDMVVILAGYEKEMNEMLKTNPGMEGRFPHKFYFPDYNACELNQIALNLLEKCDYSLDNEAKSALYAEIEATVARKDHYFSNARWINNFVENGIISSVADRLAKQYSTNDSVVKIDDLCTIRATDIRNAAKSFSCSKPCTRRIGFQQC